MNKFKKQAGRVWRTVRECLLHSLVPLFMYCAMSGLLLVVLTKNADKSGEVARNTVILWTVVFGAISLAYNGLLAWGCGGSHFEQLISGNMKRRSAMELGSELNIARYKEHKEYRPWKGFAIGCFVALPTLIGGIVFGALQPKIEAGSTGTGAAVAMLIFYFVAGWALLPFQYLHAAHYGLSTLFAILPVVVTGVFYIAGAYARRASIRKKQALADRKSAEQEAKPKKINYGGLPGTKPNKRK